MKSHPPSLILPARQADLQVQGCVMLNLHAHSLLKCRLCSEINVQSSLTMASVPFIHACFEKTGAGQAQQRLATAITIHPEACPVH